MGNQEDIANFQALNLREDEAMPQGIRVVRYLIQHLCEAQANPTLQLTVKGLKRGDIIHPVLLPSKEASPHPQQPQSNQNGSKANTLPRRHATNSPPNSHKWTRRTPSLKSKTSFSSQSKQSVYGQFHCSY